MKRDTFIKPEQAIKLGIATGMYEGQEGTKPQAKSTPILAMKNQSKIAAMSKTLTEVKSLLASVKALFKAQIKNMNVQLEDGTLLYVMSEDGELVGKIAYIADSEGNPTDELAPAGNHKLQDGRTITVGEGGEITAVAEASAEGDPDMPDDDELMKALKAENAALKAELDGVKASLTEFKTVLASLKTNSVPPAKAAMVTGRTKDEPKPGKSIAENRAKLKEAKIKAQEKFTRK